MKKCPICGSEYERENTCPICGIVLIDTETNSAVKIEPEKKGRFGIKKKKGEEPSATADPFAVAADPFAAAAGIEPEKPVAEAPVTDEFTTNESVTDGFVAEESMTTEKPVETAGSKSAQPSRRDMADPFAAAAAGTSGNRAAQPSESDVADPFAAAAADASGSRAARPSESDVADPFAAAAAGASGSRAAQPSRKNIMESNDGAGKSDAGSGFRFNPVYVVVAVVAVLLIVAIVFIVRGMKAKKEAEQAAQQYQMVDQYEDESEQEEEEIDLSEVDVNTVDESYWEYTGEIERAGATAVLALEEPLTFYAYNVDNEKTLLKNVHDVYIDSTKSIDMSDFYGKETTVGGYLTIEGNKVLIEVMDAESDDMEDDLAIHEYRIVVSDVSWSQAKAESESAGGYLARINSIEEYNYITNMLISGGYTKDHFYLGGRREDNGSEYFWVNADNQFMGDAINTSSSWSNGCWYNNEPSFVDTGSGANGEIKENVMNLFYVNGRWYLNDSSEDLAGNYPDLMRGKVGYIIEFE